MTPQELASEIANVATREPWITSIGVSLKGNTGAEAAELIEETIRALQDAGVDLKGIRVDAVFANVGKPVVVGGLPVHNARSVDGVTVLADLDLNDRMEIMLRR